MRGLPQRHSTVPSEALGGRRAGVVDVVLIHVAGGDDLDRAIRVEVPRDKPRPAIVRVQRHPAPGLEEGRPGLGEPDSLLERDWLSRADAGAGQGQVGRHHGQPLALAGHRARHKHSPAIATAIGLEACIGEVSSFAPPGNIFGCDAS